VREPTTGSALAWGRNGETPTWLRQGLSRDGSSRTGQQLRWQGI